MLRSLACGLCRRLSSAVAKPNVAVVGYVGGFGRVAIRWKSQTGNDERDPIPGRISSRFERFPADEPLLDVEEERRKSDEADEELYDEFHGINLTRGTTGVFDIDDLVTLLRRENAVNVFVAKIPDEFRYANYMVVVTGKSFRHMRSMAEFILRVFKRKMDGKDKVPVIEGKASKDWMAIDLVNIVVHIFDSSARNHFDLETLWSVGKEYDTLSKETDSLNIFLSDYKDYLSDFTPDTETEITTECDAASCNQGDEDKRVSAS